ncbi:hypothetical protein D0865_03780 [Hortaea werneckii]|uniref:Uncharacterized protein n=1 Tax=Hortaea werneckii TaxID=91943 RepID=A0A3M7CW47_HORWE|nr:hypothetical protein D0865_03780 [Hortaea werneckii]
MLCRKIGTWPARGRAWSAGRWALTTRRTYANARKAGSPANDAVTIPQAWHGKGPQAVMGSVTTENAQKTSIQDLLNGIRPQRAQDQDGQGKSALLALLLTPSYASDALNSDLPLSVLKRLNDQDLGNLSWPLDVVTAVVDRIPSKKDLKGGREGLAYMLQHNSEPLDTAAQTPLSPSAQKPGSISFELPSNTERPQHYTVQLPLAHTVFFSGMVSTLVHSRYTSENGTPAVQSQKNLERETLCLPLDSKYNTFHQNVPLIPLTPLRTVRHHMGNIIRTLSTPTGPGAPTNEASTEQAASTELEAAVTGYFEAKNIPPEPVNVWAVIVPGAFDKLARADFMIQKSVRRLTKEAMTKFWKGEDSFKSTNFYLMNSMRVNGARLVKVLSGGGGWGKKAGLLSLDPDSMYSNRELRSDDGWKFNFEDESEDAAEKQQKEALGEIVKEGEQIMFMLGPVDNSYQDKRAQESVDQADRATLFGVIPSSIDTIPTEQKDSESVDAVFLEQNFFGALSEGGMAVTIKQPEKPDLQSKVDVPYGHIRLTETVSDGEEMMRYMSGRTKRIEQLKQWEERSKLAKAKRAEDPKLSEKPARKKGHDKSSQRGMVEVRRQQTEARSTERREKARQARIEREREASNRLEEARRVQSHDDTANDDSFWRKTAESTGEASNASRGEAEALLYGTPTRLSRFDFNVPYDAAEKAAKRFHDMMDRRSQALQSENQAVEGKFRLKRLSRRMRRRHQALLAVPWDRLDISKQGSEWLQITNNFLHSCEKDILHIERKYRVGQDVKDSSTTSNGFNPGDDEETKAGQRQSHLTRKRKHLLSTQNPSASKPSSSWLRIRNIPRDFTPPLRRIRLTPEGEERQEQQQRQSHLERRQEYLLNVQHRQRLERARALHDDKSSVWETMQKSDERDDTSMEDDSKARTMSSRAQQELAQDVEGYLKGYRSG